MTHAARSRVLVDRPTVSRSPERDSRLRLHVVVEVVAVGLPVENARPSLSVSLLLDVSGSMQGEPMRQVCRSAELLAEMLKPEDKLGIAVFADRAVELAALAPMTREAKRTIKRRLDTVEAGGRTNMEAALREGKRQLGDRSEHERRVALLLSDGRPTCGADAPGELERLAAAFRPDACVATLGFGPMHDPGLLFALARGGGGDYRFIRDPDESLVQFSRAIGAQVDVVADTVRLCLQPRDAVEIVEVHDHAARFTRQGLVVDLPDLREGASHFVVVELAVEPDRERGAQELMTVRLSHRVCVTGATQHAEDVASITIADHETTDAEAQVVVALSLAERERREAQSAADRGNFDAAAAILAVAIARLEAAPGYRAGDGSALSEGVEQLIDERAAYARRPSAEEYAAFKANNLGIDVAQGSRHPDAAAMNSERSRVFIHDLLGSPENVELVIQSKGGQEHQRIPLSGREFTIGRVQTNDIFLPGGNVSKRHATMSFRDGKIVVTDLSSTNGTYVNRRRIHQPTTIASGDRVYIGDYVIRIDASS